MDSNLTKPAPLSPSLDSLDSQLNFINNLKLLQHNWDEENSKILKYWKESQEIWKLEKDKLLLQINELNNISQDERLCFMNELENLTTEVYILFIISIDVLVLPVPGGPCIKVNLLFNA